MNELTLAPNPSLVETLATMRSWLPPDLLHGIRSGHADHFCAFSDFSAPPRAEYETYATYILDSVRKVELLDRLRALRREHGVEERMPDFKSRRDRLKARILQPWVEAFAQTPGLLVVMAWHRDLRTRPAEVAPRRAFAAAVREHGIGVKPEVLLEMMRKISLYGIIAPFLRPRERLLWVVDNDAVMDGEASTFLRRSLNAMHDFVDAPEIGLLGLAPPFTDEHDDFELLLSVADIAAGALAESLKLGPNRETRLAPRVGETWPLLDGLGSFRSAATASGEVSRLLLLVHDPVSSTDSVWRRAELTRGSGEGAGIV